MFSNDILNQLKQDLCKTGFLTVVLGWFNFTQCKEKSKGSQKEHFRKDRKKEKLREKSKK
jgi:hypothetical protein